MTDDGKVKQLRPALSEAQQEMLDKLDELRAGVKSGAITAIQGQAVYEDEDGEESVETFEEGVAADDAQIVLGLESLARDYREQWEAERLNMRQRDDE